MQLLLHYFFAEVNIPQNKLFEEISQKGSLDEKE